MNDELVKRIKFSKWWKGVRKNHAGAEKKIYLHGFDTETWMGRVYLTGFYDRRGYSNIYGIRQDHAGRFLKWLSTFDGGKRKNYKHVVAAHNLKFDLGVLFWKLLNPLGHSLRSQKRSLFSYVPLRAKVEIFWRRPCFAKITFRGKFTVLVVDTFSFFPTSLRKILQMIGGEDQKLDTPSNLGNRVVSQAEIIPYNNADCVGVYRILEFVQSKHREFDARFCVSLPHLSGRIFRHHFLKKDFVLPPYGALLAGMLSYHGGKNTWLGKPGWYKAYDLDVRSAFPEAMIQMPNFSSGIWKRVKKLEPWPGFYLIQGRQKSCNWGSIFSHSFKKIAGEFSPVWVTSYELDESLRSGEFHGTVLDGWVFHSDGGPSPFAEFVQFFFRKKEEAKTRVEREFYKLTLNSLYGKFIQKTEDEQTGDLRTGGLFDPCVASLITGFVRAKIHRLEHKYNALHTATDGILTRKRPDDADLGDSIGQLKQENYGPCLILRNKLYLHYDEEGHLKKRGLHGFQGTPEELLSMWKEKRKYYSIDRLISWAESWGMGKQPGQALNRKMVLNAIKG